MQVNGQTMPGTSDSLLLEELKMTRYDKDTSADAVILSDKGVFQLAADKNQYDFKKFSSRVLKIKILSKAGLEYGTHIIRLFNHTNFGEDMTYLSAATYNLENGKIIRSPFAMSELKETVIPNQITEEKFSLPNVKVGSVIYISYTIKSPYNVYFNWLFQYTIPVISSQVTLIIPPFCHYRYLMQNIDTNDLISHIWTDNTDRIIGNQHYEDLIFSYALKDIPAFKDDAFISTPEDYVMQIAFQFVKWDAKGFTALNGKTFMSTWTAFTDKLLLDYTYFGGYLYSKENYVAKLAKQLDLDKKPQIEKVKTIVNYVKAAYSWNYAYDILSDKKMDDFITDKSGNTAAINLFLTALLKAAGINANPVLISTRGHGKIKTNYPFLGLFNDVVCYVKTDSLSLLLDATEPALPYYAIPPQCTNGAGYIVQKNDSSWVDLKPQMPSGIMENLILKISPGFDSLHCRFNIKASGYSGYEYRKYAYKGYDTLNTQLLKNKEMHLSDSIKIFSLDKPEEPFSIIYSTSSPLSFEKTDSTKSSKVLFRPFLNEPVSDNPLKTDDRKYPIDMEFPHDYKYNSIVVIPAGFKLAEKPTDTEYAIPGGHAKFSYTVKQLSDGAVQFTSNLIFTVPVFEPSEYKELKKLYDVAIKKWKEPVILEKK